MSEPLMAVEYRPATTDDLAFIKEVAGHASVRANKPDQKRFYQWLDRYMAGDRHHHKLCHAQFVITLDGLSVGHIVEYLFDREVRFGRDSWGKMSYLGFDLHPDYSGRGIMESALRRYLNDGFEGGRFKHLVVECLSNNTRDKQLLEDLGFRALRVSVLDQFLNMWKLKMPRLKARYYYSDEQWSSQVMRETAS